MTLTLTARDHDLLETLTRRVRLLTVHHAAQVWWPETRNQGTARRRLELLARAGWIEFHIIRTQTELVPAELTEAVLNHLARYRLTVFAALERLPVFSAMGPRQVKDVLRDCQRQSLVGSAPLHHGAKYWYLDAVGTERCGLAEQQIGPLSEPAKLRALALLRFCCLSDEPRHRLTPDDLARHFPSLQRPGLPSGYYFDPAGSGRLGLARIDAGRRGRWDRVLQSLRTDIDDHVRQPGFKRLIEAGRFEITVLTVFRQKARRIYEALTQVPEARRVPLQVVALPELLPLIGSGR